VPYHIQTLGLQITQVHNNNDEYYVHPKQMRYDLNLIIITTELEIIMEI
jgi:hypothetical protein